MAMALNCRDIKPGSARGFGGGARGRILDRPIQYAFQFLRHDLLFNDYLVRPAPVGFHAGRDEAATGDNLDGGIQLSSDLDRLKHCRITRNGQDEQRCLFDSCPAERFLVADVAGDDVDANMRTSLNGGRIQLDHAKRRMVCRQHVRSHAARHAEPRDDRVPIEELTILTAGPAHLHSLRRSGTMDVNATNRVAAADCKPPALARLRETPRGPQCVHCPIYLATLRGGAFRPIFHSYVELHRAS